MKRKIIISLIGIAVLIPLGLISRHINCFIVEFSQLITWSFLVEFRKTFLGHVMLGQGFLWVDLVAYTIGIACIFGLFRLFEKTK